MALVRWEPVRELTTLQNEMNRLLTNATGGTARRWVPAIDLVEADDHYILRADLPGLGPDDVDLEVDDNVLTISGERVSQHDPKGAGYYRLERASGTFRRAL